MLLRNLPAGKNFPRMEDFETRSLRKVHCGTSISGSGGRVVVSSDCRNSQRNTLEPIIKENQPIARKSIVTRVSEMQQTVLMS